jgi:hypothetical protein
MDETSQDSSPPAEVTPTEVPLGQRLFDRPFLLLLLGLLVMFLFYTGWGMYEVLTLPEAALP